MRLCHLASVAVLGALLVLAVPVWAQTPPQQHLQFKESWRKVQPWEYATTGALLTFGFTARFALPPPDPNWRGTFDLEQDILDAIAVRQDPARQNIETVSDIFFGGAMAYRFMDSLVIPGLFYHNPKLAWQLSWIDLESFSLVAAVEWGAQLFVGRVRPASNNCSDPSREGHYCNPNGVDYARSFIAGHPATVITAAGLTCLHHAHLPLYGGGAADDIACGAMIGAAVVDGVARVVAEDHYPSDLLFGTVLGLTAGWILAQDAALRLGRRR